MGDVTAVRCTCVSPSCLQGSDVVCVVPCARFVTWRPQRRYLATAHCEFYKESVHVCPASRDVSTTSTIYPWGANGHVFQHRGYSTRTKLRFLYNNYWEGIIMDFMVALPPYVTTIYLYTIYAIGGFPLLVSKWNNIHQYQPILSDTTMQWDWM